MQQRRCCGVASVVLMVAIAGADSSGEVDGSPGKASSKLLTKQQLLGSYPRTKMHLKGSNSAKT
ncbi:unnamed protein product, partial [Ectocarpus sp. 4 AP-2014]